MSAATELIPDVIPSSKQIEDRLAVINAEARLLRKLHTVARRRELEERQLNERLAKGQRDE